MKKFVDGKMYNTDTSEKIAFWSNDLFSSDFNYLDSELYLSSKGSYFLIENENAGTIWELLTKEDAFDWLSEKNLIEEIEEHFSEFIVEG